MNTPDLVAAIVPVIGVLKVQSDALDEEYMKEWAAELGVDDLLERAVAEVSGC